MKQSPSEMSASAIERELEKFAWEYIAASDKAQTDAEYRRLASALDERKAALESEITKRANTGCSGLAVGSDKPADTRKSVFPASWRAHRASR